MIKLSLDGGVWRGEEARLKINLEVLLGAEMSGDRIMRAPPKGYRTFTAMHSTCERVGVCTSVHVSPAPPFMLLLFQYLRPSQFTSFFSC